MYSPNSDMDVELGAIHLPSQVRFSIEDWNGRPVDAELRISGPVSFTARTVGGRRTVTLPDGRYTVHMTPTRGTASQKTIVARGGAVNVVMRAGEKVAISSGGLMTNVGEAPPTSAAKRTAPRPVVQKSARTATRSAARPVTPKAATTKPVRATAILAAKIGGTRPASSLGSQTLAVKAAQMVAKAPERAAIASAQSVARAAASRAATRTVSSATEPEFKAQVLAKLQTIATAVAAGPNASFEYHPSEILDFEGVAEAKAGSSLMGGLLSSPVIAQALKAAGVTESPRTMQQTTATGETTTRVGGPKPGGLYTRDEAGRQIPVAPEQVAAAQRAGYEVADRAGNVVATALAANRLGVGIGDEVSRALRPRIDRIDRLMTEAQQERRATSEHNRMMADADFKRFVRARLNAIYEARRGSRPNILEYGELSGIDEGTAGNDEELGFLGLEKILGGIPIVGDLLGGGGGGKGGAAGGGGIMDLVSSLLPLAGTVAGGAFGGPIGASLGGALGGMLGGGGEKGGVTGPAPVPGLPVPFSPGVSAAIGQIPANIREEVKSAVREINAEGAQGKDLSQSISEKVGADVSPQINRVLAALQEQKNQTQATQEHRTIVQRDDRFREMTEKQRATLAALARLEQRLGTSRLYEAPQGRIGVMTRI